MSHIRKPLVTAVAINTAIFVVEAIAGYQANSLALIMDSIHNFSDQLALVFLFLAYRLPIGFSRNLIRSSNLLNSLGLVAISGFMAWQTVERILHPGPVLGFVPVIVGVASAIANYGVARVLKRWANTSAAIHLAYVHNMGDVLVSLVPATAGLLTILFRSELMDPIVALGIAAWLIWSTVQEVRGSSEQLLWPEQATCPHEEHVPPIGSEVMC